MYGYEEITLTMGLPQVYIFMFCLCECGEIISLKEDEQKIIVMKKDMFWLVSRFLRDCETIMQILSFVLLLFQCGAAAACWILTLGGIIIIMMTRFLRDCSASKGWENTIKLCK